MRGVITHVSDLNISTACTTALKNIPETLGMSPSHPRIIYRRTQIFRDFMMFPATDGQSSSSAIKTRPRYLKGVTVSIGLS